MNNFAELERSLNQASRIIGPEGMKLARLELQDRIRREEDQVLELERIIKEKDILDKTIAGADKILKLKKEEEYRKELEHGNKKHSSTKQRFVRQCSID